MYFLPRVLFVCTFRGGRSQIANDLAKKIASDALESECACFDPGKISQDFVDLIASFGIAINRDSPPSVFDLAKSDDNYEYVICLCRETDSEMCALFRQNIDKIFPHSIENLHWNIPDFRECKENGMDFRECVKDVCKNIEMHIAGLADRIKTATNGQIAANRRLTEYFESRAGQADTLQIVID